MAELQGVTVVVTRPAHQAETLCRLLEHHQARVIRFPVLEIVPVHSDSLSQLLHNLANFDIAIFISPNAVHQAMAEIAVTGALPRSIKVAAVGKPSADALAQYGVTVDIFPQQAFNSEALLALPAMQHIEGKRVVIFRGVGGRELLATTLIERGAQVDYAECYRRQKPRQNSQTLNSELLAHKVDIIIVTSGEGLENLVDLVGASAVSHLQRLPLVVVSERMKIAAEKLGFQSDIVVAAKASDEDLFNAVLQWRQTLRRIH